MTETKDDIKKGIDEAAKYLKKKADEMESHQSSGITDARQKAHKILDNLKQLFSRFEIDLKNRE